MAERVSDERVQAWLESGNAPVMGYPEMHIREVFLDLRDARARIAELDAGWGDAETRCAIAESKVCALEAALKEAELALRAWQWAIADKGAPVGDSEMSLNLSADAIRRSNAELVLKAEAMTDAALTRLAEVRK